MQPYSSTQLRHARRRASMMLFKTQLNPNKPITEPIDSLFYRKSFLENAPAAEKEQLLAYSSDFLSKHPSLHLLLRQNIDLSEMSSKHFQSNPRHRGPYYPVCVASFGGLLYALMQ